MTEGEPTLEGEVEPPVVTPEPTLLEMFQAQQTQLGQLTELVGKLATPAPPAEPTPPTTPEPAAPERPGNLRGAQVQEYVGNLERYASQQSQRVMAHTLARSYGIDVDELGFEHDNPEAMKLRAMELAQEKKMEALNNSYQDQLKDLEERLVSTQQGQVPEAPDGTGGPSGREVLGVSEIEDQRKAILAKGKTPQARREMIQLAFSDPSRRI